MSIVIGRKWWSNHCFDKTYFQNSAAMIEIQQPITYNMGKEAPDRRLSLNMAAVRRRQRMLRRMSSCPEDLEWQPEMDFHRSPRPLSQEAVQRLGKLFQNVLLYRRVVSRRQNPFLDSEAGQTPVLRPPHQLETPTEFDDTDGPVHVRTRHVERQLGGCPRKSLEMRLLGQDSSFDVNPVPGCHPLLRCHSDTSLDRSPPTDCMTTGLFQMIKDALFRRDVSIW